MCNELKTHKDCQVSISSGLLESIRDLISQRYSYNDAVSFFVQAIRDKVDSREVITVLSLFPQAGKLIADYCYCSYYADYILAMQEGGSNETNRSMCPDSHPRKS